MFRVLTLAPAMLAAALAQTSGKVEFEVASIKANAPQAGFHFASESVSGGPGTPDPGMFRCSRCSLATLILKAFNLQPCQFPGRTAFTENTYDVVARIPAGASEEEFSAMLQNLLKDRFGLQWHFQEKAMKGYRLIVAKNGPKLKESGDASVPPAGAPGGYQHGSGSGESHSHSGAMVFGDSAFYRSPGQTMAGLARILSDQLGAPVDDGTALTGNYEISLRWSGASGGSTVNHSDGAFGGGAGHAGHDGAAVDSSSPALFEALQQQLGLRLIPAEQTAARLFVVDRVSQRPAEN